MTSNLNREFIVVSSSLILIAIFLLFLTKIVWTFWNCAVIFRAWTYSSKLSHLTNFRNWRIAGSRTLSLIMNFEKESANLHFFTRWKPPNGLFTMSYFRLAKFSKLTVYVPKRNLFLAFISNVSRFLYYSKNSRSSSWKEWQANVIFLTEDNLELSIWQSFNRMVSSFSESCSHNVSHYFIFSISTVIFYLNMKWFYAAPKFCSIIIFVKSF